MKKATLSTKSIKESIKKILELAENGNAHLKQLMTSINESSEKMLQHSKWQLTIAINDMNSSNPVY